MTKRHPNPYRPQLVARAISKLSGDVTSASGRTANAVAAEFAKPGRLETLWRAFAGCAQQRFHGVR